MQYHFFRLQKGVSEVRSTHFCLIKIIGLINPRAESF